MLSVLVCVEVSKEAQREFTLTAVARVSFLTDGSETEMESFISFNTNSFGSLYSNLEQLNYRILPGFIVECNSISSLTK